MEKEYLELKDLKIGMKTTVEALNQITNKYMILAYDKVGDKEGTLVFIGNKQNKEYDSWFKKDGIITPIFHMDEECEGYIYDD